MKKILSLLTLLMLSIVGANAEKVIYAWPSGTDAANKVTLAEGVTVQITGNESKTVSSAKSITINGTKYTSMKVSNGAQNTLTLPKKAIGITFYSYVNKASDAEGLRDSYWKEVAGESYDAETSGGLMSCFSDGDLSKPDVRSYSFAATDVITFTNTGEQLCYVMEVEYDGGGDDADAVYTVVGNSEAIFGAEWDVNATANDMTAGADGIYTLTKEGVQLENGFKLEYKVVKNRAYENGQWPLGNNADFTVWEGTGLYDVTFTFNLAENTVDCAMTKQAVDLTEYKTALETLINQVKALNLDMFNDDVATAEAALNAEDATAESLTAATATLKNAVLAKLNEALDIASQFATTYGYNDVNTYITMAKGVVASGNLQQLANLMPTAANALSPKVQDALQKISAYAEVIDNAELNAALAAAMTAAQGTDYFATIKALQDAADAFLVASQQFVQQVEAIDTEGKEKGEELAAALEAAKTVLSSTESNIVDIGVAIQALVKAYQEFEEANKLVIESMTIVGDFLGFETEEENFNPANGWPMIQDADNPAIWSLTKENVVVEGKQYNYKATANGVYGVYELPAQGNQNWVFGTEMYPAGTYNLTFTADTEKHELTLVVDKQAEATEFLILTLDGRADITEGKALLVEATEEVSANIWIKKEAAGARGIAKVPAVEIMEDGIAMLLIEDADLTSGQFSIYADKQFEIAKVTLLPNPDAATGEQIYPVVEPVNPFENVTIDPAVGEVANLQEFTLTFTNAQNAQGAYYDDSDKPYVVSADNSFVEYGDFDYGQGFNEVVVRLGSAVTTAGEYTLVIPAGTITADDATNAKDLKFNYTVKGEKEFSVYVVNVPADFGTPWAYAWSGDGDAAVPVKAWPGEKMGKAEMNDEMTQVTKWVFQVTAAEAPEHVIFNNGNLEAMVQTDDLDFEDGKVYDLSELLGITPANPFADITIDPAVGEVANLEEFTLTFTNAANAQGAYYDDSDKPYVVSADNSFVEYGEFDYGQGFNEVVVRLGNAVTTAGEYTLFIPAGTITADDATNAEDLKFNYTVKGEQTFEIFVKNVPADFGTPYAYAWSGDGETAVKFAGDWPGTKMGRYEIDGEMGFTWQYTGSVAPEKIIFNNGNLEAMVQTEDLAFENRKIYDLSELLGITPANPFENVTIDPAVGEVASLKEFTITFANAENAYGAYFDEADMPYLVNADNTQVFYGEFGYGFDGYNQVTVTLSEEVTLAGKYTLVIPAGTITADDATNTEALTFSYTIAEGEKQFSVYVVNVPADFGAARPFAYVWSGEGDNVTEFAGAWPGTRMGYSEVPGYSDMGFVWQITAKVAPEFIVFSNGKNSTDEGAKQTKDLEFVPNKVYDLTELLATSTGIYAINAAIADGTVVYNLQGVRVKDVKKGGMYIVNGKKQIVK